MLAKFRLALACAAVCVIATGSAYAQSALPPYPAYYPADYQKIFDGAKEEGKVVIYSTIDAKVASPLIQGFEAKYPDIQVEYSGMKSADLYNRYIREQAAGRNSGDVVWSAAMDSALKLASDYGLKYQSAEISQLHDWMVWKGSAYQTTYEPAVFIYHRGLVARFEAPGSRADLAEMIAREPDRFKNKISTYDIEKSEEGFMLEVLNKANIEDPDYYLYGLKSIAKGGLILHSSADAIMDRVSSGKSLIGYNVLNSYAVIRAKTDPAVGVVYPSDVPQVLSRVVFISKKARHRNAAKLWLDYLLSRQGQGIIANQIGLTSVRHDTEGLNDLEGVIADEMGPMGSTSPVNETLFDYLEKNKRSQFIKDWRAATGK